MCAVPVQEQPGPHHKLVSVLKETMIKGDPFPKFHGKAAETKYTHGQSNPGIYDPIAGFISSTHGMCTLFSSELSKSRQHRIKAIS